MFKLNKLEAFALSTGQTAILIMLFHLILFDSSSSSLLLRCLLRFVSIICKMFLLVPNTYMKSSVKLKIAFQVKKMNDNLMKNKWKYFYFVCKKKQNRNSHRRKNQPQTVSHDIHTHMQINQIEYQQEKKKKKTHKFDFDKQNVSRISN